MRLDRPIAFPRAHQFHAAPPQARHVVGPLQLVTLDKTDHFIPPGGRSILVLALEPSELRQGVHRVGLGAGEWMICQPDHALNFAPRVPVKLVLLPPDWPAFSRAR